MTDLKPKLIGNHLADSNATEQGGQKPDPLSTIQSQFKLVLLGGTTHVVDMRVLEASNEHGVAKSFEPIKRSEAMLQIVRVVTRDFPEADAKAIAREFFVSSQTTCYSGVEFNPAGSSPNYLNLWVAPTIKPQDGRWTLIREFIRFVICGGNEINFRYLMRYIAHALQRPWEKPGVMIILLGGQGAGKGTLARILSKIWSATFLHVHQIKSVTGDFNASLERKYIVWLDEALFAGNRSATDSLKSLVTESDLHINEKYQPSRQTKSFHRFVAASNADHFKATDRDDRRDFVLRVSDNHKGDHEYWNALYSEIENGGVEAMANKLLSFNLSKFNVRAKPNTDELVEQKLKSLDPIPRWWHDCLFSSEIADGAGWPDFVSTKAAISGVSRGRASLKPSPLELVRVLKLLCPSVHKQQKTIGDTRQRGFGLPKLVQARADFEKYLGSKLKW